jgi:hypothetical protein
MFLAGIGAMFLVYIALCLYGGRPGSGEDHIFYSVLSAVFGMPIGLAVVMAFDLLKGARARRSRTKDAPSP